MSLISSHTGFQPLEEVWLGATYPAKFYDHMDSEIRDNFYKITEWTNQDLNKIEKKLQELGVIVRRPAFTDRVDDYMDYDDYLVKPPITPRDYVLTLGNTLYIIPQGHTVEPWQAQINYYLGQREDVQVLNRFTEFPDPLCYIDPPSVVRVGRDLFFELHDGNREQITKISEKFIDNYRVHLIKTGGHSDGVFCPVRPELIFSTHYLRQYQRSFPGWEVYFLTDTTRHNGRNGKWFVPGIDNASFNDHVMQYSESWIGDFRETVFEVNMLIIDEKNLLCISEDESALRTLESYGITPHVMDFRCRGFWDGGLHCLTTDIRRSGPIIDYWPDRGPNGLDYI